jgi:hypothetical protein
MISNMTAAAINLGTIPESFNLAEWGTVYAARQSKELKHKVKS